MKSIHWILLATVFSASSSAMAAEWLLKLNRPVHPVALQEELRSSGQPVIDVEDLRFNGWYRVRTATEAFTAVEANNLGRRTRAAWVEPNKKIRAFNNRPAPRGPFSSADPAFKPQPNRPGGEDPMLRKQWHLIDTGAIKTRAFRGQPSIVVAVIDTGVDYNHPDLGPAMWTNPGEAGAKARNGIDDDGNGYVDDFMGWDFVENDNTPYDRLGGGFMGNSGHGTHCAGVIGAVGGNSFGIAGIASGVRIMPLRFISEKNEGTTADAVLAVKYALDMGAHVLSNSWGGEDENNDDSRALREIFAEVHRRGRISVVAAGNERTNVDAQPLKATPASYDMPNQLTVAATGKDGGIANFSNFGARMVHLGAPGVDILSTIPEGKFTTMDGTSMAAPVVAGAVALFWSRNPGMNHLAVREAVLSTVTPTPALQGRTLTGGRLNIEALMSRSTERFPRR